MGSRMGSRAPSDAYFMGAGSAWGQHQLQKRSASTDQVPTAERAAGMAGSPWAAAASGAPWPASGMGGGGSGVRSRLEKCGSSESLIKAGADDNSADE